jgi:hypothetical protein
MGQNDFQITTLNDIVDTLKLQFYPNSNITLDEIEKYNQIVEKFISLKNEAMEIKNHDNQKRFVKHEFAGRYFKVMAVSQSSFNVVLQNGDISIALLKHSFNHRNPLIKVEFRAEFLLRYGYINAINQVKQLISYFFDSYLVKVSEIHLAKDIQGYEFSPFDFHKIKTLSKTKTIFHNDISSEYYYGNKFTGFSVGKGDELLRVYNKTTEITQKKEKAFIEVLSWSQNPDFDKSKTVWRIEFQLRRERLKYLLGKNGLLDSLENVLKSITDLWAYCTSRFVHKSLTNAQIMEQLQGYKVLKSGTIKMLNPETLRKRFQRADISYVWQAIQTFEKKQGVKLQRVKDIKKPEVEYVKNAYKAIVSTFVKLKRGKFCSNELTEILLQANKELLEKSGMNIIDKARLNALDYMANAKVYYEQNGIIEDGFYQYQKDLKNNIFQTFSLIENEPSTLLTFEMFQKKLLKGGDYAFANYTDKVTS